MSLVRWTICLSAVAAATLILPGSGASEGRWTRFTNTRLGLSIAYPASWHVVHRRLTDCSDPTQRLALRSNDGVTILLEERLGGTDPAKGMPRRPRHFRLSGKAHPQECCAPDDTSRPGWFLDFQDAGRAFYFYVYLGGVGSRAQVLAALDSLRVSPP